MGIMLRSIGLGNSYFPTRISESEVGLFAEFRVSHALENTTSDFNGTIFPTGKLVNGTQHKFCCTCTQTTPIPVGIR